MLGNITQGDWLGDSWGSDLLSVTIPGAELHSGAGLLGGLRQGTSG